MPVLHQLTLLVLLCVVPAFLAAKVKSTTVATLTTTTEFSPNTTDKPSASSKTKQAILHSGNHTSANKEEDEDRNLLHEELNVLLKEMRHVAEAIESVRKEHSRLAKGVGEISSAVKDMNVRSEHIRKKVKKMSKTINKNTHHHKLKDTLKSLQKDHEHILKAVTAMSSHRRTNHDGGSVKYHTTRNSTRKGRLNHHKGNNSNSSVPEISQEVSKIVTTLAPDVSTVEDVTETSSTTSSPEGKDNSIPELVVEPNEEKKTPKKPPKPLPKDCTEVIQRGNGTSGVYKIQPKGLPTPIKVWCDHTTNGGGWTVIVARLPQDVQQDFNLKWEDYKKGFGDPAKEHWIGMEPLHLMTKDRRHELRVNITDWNDAEAQAEWKDFKVDNEDKGYELAVGRYTSSSTAGDALKWHDRMKFSTPDRDNDALMGGHCARKNSGGWWYRGYRGCYQAHPTGRFQKNPPKLPSSPTNSSRRNFDLGPVLAWQNWRGESYFPKKLFLMFRPVFP